jgi:ribosomal protein S27AE
MGVRELWAVLVARRWAGPGPGPGRVRVTWRICRRCGSYSFQSVGSDRLCGGCLSLQ